MSHMGMEGCLWRAQECVYWPAMSSEVKDFILKCDICRSVDNKQQKETLISHDVLDRLWAKVGVDLFTFNQTNYPITTWEINLLENTTASHIFRKMKFAQHGIPDARVSDNGPQFTAHEYKKFSKQWKFELVTTSLRYPKSSGKVENAVWAAKRLMKKVKNSFNAYLALLNYRNMPIQALVASPAQRLMICQTKTLLPNRKKSEELFQCLPCSPQLPQYANTSLSCQSSPTTDDLPNENPSANNKNSAGSWSNHGTASENSGQQATQDIGFALYISIWITLRAVLHESFSGCNTFGNQLDTRKVQRILFVANNRFLGTFRTNARKWNCEMHQKPCASWNRIIERCVLYMVSWLTALLLARWVFFCLCLCDGFLKRYFLNIPQHSQASSCSGLEYHQICWHYWEDQR